MSKKSPIIIGSASAGGTTTLGMNDDVLLTLGTDKDNVLVHKSASNSADAEITSVIVGTSDISALAANSLIISNTTTDGDILIAGSDGGNSVQAIFFDSSDGVLHLGKPGTPESATASGDCYMKGNYEVDGNAYFDGAIIFKGTGAFQFMNSTTSLMWLRSYTADSDAICFGMGTRTAANYVPVIMIGDLSDVASTDNLGLFDGLTQSLVVVLEKAGQLHTATDGIANAGGATAILNHVGGFTNAVVGDIVRITAGTNCTAGWYWITTVTSADVVVLDRNYTTGDATNVTFVTFHNFPMIGADGVCLKCFDGAPGDANVEIDRDGWLQLDLSQANGRLYWRANNAWHYVDATA